MKRKTIWILVFVILLLVAGGIVLHKINSKPLAKKPVATPSLESHLPKEVKKLSQAQKEKPHKIFGKSVVLINQSSFAPANVTVSKDSVVEWLNMETTQHQIVTDDGKTITAAQSPALAQGKAFDFSFSKTGKYSYHDSLHPQIKGKVEVQ